MTLTSGEVGWTWSASHSRVLTSQSGWHAAQMLTYFVYTCVFLGFPPFVSLSLLQFVGDLNMSDSCACVGDLNMSDCLWLCWRSQHEWLVPVLEISTWVVVCGCVGDLNMSDWCLSWRCQHEWLFVAVLEISTWVVVAVLEISTWDCLWLCWRSQHEWLLWLCWRSQHE